jgi:hypothetical protein
VAREGVEAAEVDGDRGRPWLRSRSTSTGCGGRSDRAWRAKAAGRDGRSSRGARGRVEIVHVDRAPGGVGRRDESREKIEETFFPLNNDNGE